MLVNAAGDFTYNRKLGLKFGNFIEYIWNRRVATELQSILMHENHLTFTFCGNLVHKIKRINTSMVDIAIEIHHDANKNKDIRGASVLYHPGSQKGKKLARLILDSIEKTYEVKDIYPGYYRLDKSKPILYFLEYTQMPAVIIECATLTNVSDRHMMTQNFYIYTISRRITEGIQNYEKLII